MKSGTPFQRAQLMMTAIAAVIASSQGNFVLQRAGLAGIGPYISRGKGEGKSNRRSPGAGMASKRASVKRRNVLRHRTACR